MYKGIDGYFRDNVVYPDILQSRTNYYVIPSGEWTLLLVQLIHVPFLLHTTCFLFVPCRLQAYHIDAMTETYARNR